MKKIVNLTFICSIILGINCNSKFNNKVFNESDIVEYPVNPLTSMEIHPQLISGRNGGRFGCGRTCDSSELKPHRGLDLVADSIPFYSIYSGVIVDIAERPEHGKLIVIKSVHMKLSIKYIHLSSTASGLKIGSTVTQGQLLGVSGKTGDAKDDAHLHIEIAPNYDFSDSNNRVDPELHIQTNFGKNPNKHVKYCSPCKCC